jgi:hypothetical protein
MPMKITLDANSFLAFTDRLERSLQSRQGPLDLGELPAEIIRLETNFLPAGAGELVVTLYPSDGLLRFAAAVWARESHLLGVQVN